VFRAVDFFHGRAFKLPLNNGPNAIHGFAVDAPWEVYRAQS
jgi:aldose 1-epimerase